METSWCVITGGPCSGKTFTIGYLSYLGYHTVVSPSRVYINVEMSKGKTIKEIRSNEAEFQRKVFDMKMKQIGKIPHDRLVFFERGIPDSIAYYKHYDEDPSGIVGICREIRYKKVFLLDRFPFVRDYARVENEHEAGILHKLIREAYLDLDYDVTEVPIRPIDERAMMILEKINHLL